MVRPHVILPPTPSRGLQQGDLLSPFLFLICAEGFSSLIRNEERVGRIREISMNAYAKTISHVFFADDSMLFCRTTEVEACNMKCLLQRYNEGSGQFINLEKSSVHFSVGCSQGLKTQLAHVLAIRHQEGFGKYLVIHADFGGL